MRQEIRMDTMASIQKFVDVVSRIPERVTLEDSDGHIVSAKSLLGAIYTMEWDRIYCVCERDIAGMILPWIA